MLLTCASFFFIKIKKGTVVTKRVNNLPLGAIAWAKNMI